jgi:hypothetical protein
MARTRKPSGRKQERRRPIDSFRRGYGERKEANPILIVCEGEKTEPLYFDDLRRRFRLSAVQVKIVGGEAGTAPISIVNYAARERNNQNYHYEAIWCVFDREGVHINASFDEAVNQASRLNYRLAISNPAFEYWYLLHFEETTHPFTNAGEVIEKLRNYLPKYEKRWRDFSLLFNRLNVALVHAERVLKSHQQDTNETYPCPSTCVHELVGDLRSMGTAQ